jgi:hypothetical protein
MPGLVPGILFAAAKRIAGTSPAMMSDEKGMMRIEEEGD